MTSHFLHRRNHQAGAATLIVVMMLFLVMALLAAYANRSLLFEQRMAISYGRASLSQEVAEGGIEWTLAQLNGTTVDATCKPVDSGGQKFADRYLQIDATSRSIMPIAGNIKGIDCARDPGSNGWACRCPAAGTPYSSSSAIDAQPASSFSVLMIPSGRAGTLKLDVTGCTDSIVANCLITGIETSQSLLAKTRLSTLVALVSAVRSPPAAPLVVKGGVESSGAGLGLHNTDPRSGGMLAVLGGEWHGMVNERLDTVPGSTLSQALIQTDKTLSDPNLDADGVFKKFMGTSVNRYPLHPSLRTINCNSDCSSAIEDAYKAGKRVLWIDGPMSISSNKVLGSVSDPMLVIANGDVNLSGSFQFTGMLVSHGDMRWTNVGGAAPRITGIMLVGGSMTTVGNMDIVYQQTVADQLRNRMGSYVRVPGSWIDTAQQL